jgi:hypothetical protein
VGSNPTFGIQLVKVWDEYNLFQSLFSPSARRYAGFLFLIVNLFRIIVTKVGAAVNYYRHFEFEKIDAKCIIYRLVVYRKSFLIEKDAKMPLLDCRENLLSSNTYRNEG